MKKRAATLATFESTFTQNHTLLQRVESYLSPTDQKALAATCRLAQVSHQDGLRNAIKTVPLHGFSEHTTKVHAVYFFQQAPFHLLCTRFQQTLSNNQVDTKQFHALASIAHQLKDPLPLTTVEMELYLDTLFSCTEFLKDFPKVKSALTQVLLQNVENAIHLRQQSQALPQFSWSDTLRTHPASTRFPSELTVAYPNTLKFILFFKATHPNFHMMLQGSEFEKIPKAVIPDLARFYSDANPSGFREFTQYDIFLHNDAYRLFKSEMLSHCPIAPQNLQHFSQSWIELNPVRFNAILKKSRPEHVLHYFGFSQKCHPDYRMNPKDYYEKARATCIKDPQNLALINLRWAADNKALFLQLLNAATEASPIPQKTRCAIIEKYTLERLFHRHDGAFYAQIVTDIVLADFLQTPDDLHLNYTHRDPFEIEALHRKAQEKGLNLFPYFSATYPDKDSLYVRVARDACRMSYLTLLDIPRAFSLSNPDAYLEFRQAAQETLSELRQNPQNTDLPRTLDELDGDILPEIVGQLPLARRLVVYLKNAWAILNGTTDT